MDQKKTPKDNEALLDELDKAQREHWDVERKANNKSLEKYVDEENRKFLEEAKRIEQNVRLLHSRFNEIVDTVFERLGRYAPITDEKDACALIDTFVQKAQDIICENACGGAWDCEHCPVHWDFAKIKEGMKEDEQQ